MSIQPLHSSSISLSRRDLQNFNPKEHSLGYTIKKTIVISGMVLGGASLVAGVTLLGLATAGSAIPIAAPFVLGSIGASGMTGAGCVLSRMKFHQSTKNMLKVTHILKESADDLKEAFRDQKNACDLATDVVRELANACSDVRKSQEEISRGCIENEAQIHKEAKKVEEAGKELNTQISLLKLLNEKLANAEKARD
ncbi:MAG: hypothetical protein LBC45_04645 [Chlamydiales bacterium]|jgi:hypothetical protein|nr:hypothetical protein [Chlamydiales bacterium]